MESEPISGSHIKKQINMQEDIIDKIVVGQVQLFWTFVKWLVLQYVLLALIPSIGGCAFSVEVITCMTFYTLLYNLYWRYVPKQKRLSFIFAPYIAYLMFLFICYIGSSYFSFNWFLVLLPFWGLACFMAASIIKRNIIKKNNTIPKQMLFIGSVMLILVLLKVVNVSWGCKGHGDFEGEKKEILQRRDYLISKLITSPKQVLKEMPTGIGEQFQGEWALYSCSMLSAALKNISILYPETKEENLRNIDSLITIVMSPELRTYDTDRWNEDALRTLSENTSHVSYISHLAWMITEYKALGGDGKYDEMLDSLCSAMNRRIMNRKAYNLETYPDEPIYIPDMLVAIIALKHYGSKYDSTVKAWVEKARNEWCDKETGLLVSFLDEDGKQIANAPIKGSYSALNCSYLTFIDKDFAHDQYDLLKKHFWKKGFLDGFREYHDDGTYFGFDIDAGPVLFGLSPSGTAFATGAVTFFEDHAIRNQILRTAEIAGHTVQWNGTRHYVLANLALVGEAVMLAMRTNIDISH